MTIWPGDELETDEGERIVIQRQVAYRGNPDCTNLATRIEVKEQR